MACITYLWLYLCPICKLTKLSLDNIEIFISYYLPIILLLLLLLDCDIESNPDPEKKKQIYLSFLVTGM